MRFNTINLVITALLLVTPSFATTYWGGFEDTVGSGADYDYNDMVFSISGDGLTLNTATGVWFNKSSAGVWNNTSLDSSGGDSVGSCIYGGGVCNGGVALAAGDQYLATATGHSVNDVYFSVNGNVTEQVTLSISADTNTLGWQLKSGGAINHFTSGVQGPVNFTPGGDFILVGLVGGGPTFTSNSAANDGVSHFAFFGPSAAAPEPASIALLGFALLGGGLVFRKKVSQS
jgi:hypothetical protein